MLHRRVARIAVVVTPLCVCGCSVGSYCVAGREMLCPAGQFGSVVNLSTPLCSGSCQQGHFCPTGSMRANQTVRLCIRLTSISVDRRQSPHLPRSLRRGGADVWRWLSLLSRRREQLLGGTVRVLRLSRGDAVAAIRHQRVSPRLLLSEWRSGACVVCVRASTVAALTSPSL